MAVVDVRIQIKAQPQAFYRERYNSELDSGRNRAQRFIRTDANPDNYDYPTIEVLRQWDANQYLYIRVTLVTVLTQQAPIVCVHPHPIDTPDSAIKDPASNTLYFPLTREDFSAGWKNFRITRRKLVQHELRNYGQLYVLNTDQRDIQRIDDPNDARKLIEIYQLGKSQLVFSLAKLIREDQLPVIYDATSIYSNIMTAVTSTSINTDDILVKYAPQRGSWNGGEQVLMFIPRIDRRRTCRVLLEYSSTERINDIPVEYVDTKTISFITPPCPFPPTAHQSITIPFIVIQGNEEIARADFFYHSMNQCIICHANDVIALPNDVVVDPHMKTENSPDE